MEENQEQRHVCKFCNKDFACGRSLGGHMRSHMRNSSTPSVEKKKASSSVNGGSSSNNNTDLLDFDAGGHVGYGLRENPRKTWRLSDSIDDCFKQDKVCKECGKGFQSWKALFGHMSSHSERERVSVSLEDDYWIDGDHKQLIMDSQSETETAAAPRRRRRSSRTRYKNTTNVTASSSFSFANASSSVTGIEHEQEDVAMCLMMLSRDVGYWGGLNSVGDSWDNNSLVVEVRSSSLVKEISEKENCNVDHIVKLKKVKDKNARFERKGSNSHFGSLRNGFKKLESDVSLDGTLAEYKFKKPKCDDEDGGVQVSDVGLRKSSCGKNKVKCTEAAEVKKKLVKEVDDQTDSECGKYNSSKRIHRDTSEMEEESPKKLKCDVVDSPSKNKFECTACNKTFHSYQALGGHRASHKRTKGCFQSKTESSETSIEINASPDSRTDSKLIIKSESPVEGTSCAEASYASKKLMKHECPICSKVFASGQALGGHKRSHVLESSEARGNQTIVIQQQLPEIRDLLDLNLPAPVEEETNGRIAYRPWWIGNNHKHEQAVGLIFN